LAYVAGTAGECTCRGMAGPNGGKDTTRLVTFNRMYDILQRLV